MTGAVMHVTSNLAKESTPAQVARDCATIMDHGGDRPVVWRVQECETAGHVRALLDTARRHGLSIYWPGGTPRVGTSTPVLDVANVTPILWTTSRFERLDSGLEYVHAGERGVSWTKYVAWVGLRDKVTGRKVAAVVAHPVAQAWTSHPERRPKWEAMITTVHTVGVDLAEHYELVVGGADLNRNRYSLLGARMLYASHGTYGGAYYDALWLAGALAKTAHVEQVQRLSLASDHDALCALVTVPAKEKPVTTPLRVDGIDVHHAKRNVDLAVAQRAGLKFVYQKVSQGASFVDDYYERRRAAAHALHLDFGGYHYAETHTSGASQATRFLNLLDARVGELVPMLDLEDYPDGNSYFSRLSLDARTRWVGQFVDTVVDRLGVRPIIYTPFDLTNSFGCPLWVARYSNSNTAPRIPRPWRDATIRQFSNGDYGVPHTFPGLREPVDLNTLPGGVATLDDLRIPITHQEDDMATSEAQALLKEIDELTSAAAATETRISTKQTTYARVRSDRHATIKGLAEAAAARHS